MKDKNLDDTNNLEDEWDEDDILSNDLSSMSNMSNMISISNIFMPNTPNIPNILSINNDNILEDIFDENKENNKD
ncbi:hypothetical protein [Clostridium sp.]|uniref:hypothetical protein n=1 Tax=Clostridium sp. TaxID=1506 RepID=UPI003D6CA803